MKYCASLIMAVSTTLVLSGCLHTPPGGNAVIDTPRHVGSLSGQDVHEITCDRAHQTRCAIAIKEVCPSEVSVLEERSRGGFVNGAPAHLIEVAFQCKP